jgi:hypothetical protein
MKEIIDPRVSEGNRQEGKFDEYSLVPNVGNRSQVPTIKPVETIHGCKN